MADFDPFENQGGPVAWDPEHSADAKKQAEELSRRLAADIAESGNGPSSFGGDDSSDGVSADAHGADLFDDTAETGDDA